MKFITATIALSTFVGAAQASYSSTSSSSSSSKSGKGGKSASADQFLGQWLSCKDRFVEHLEGIDGDALFTGAEYSCNPNPIPVNAAGIFTVNQTLSGPIQIGSYAGNFVYPAKCEPLGLVGTNCTGNFQNVFPGFTLIMLLGGSTLSFNPLKQNELVFRGDTVRRAEIDEANAIQFVPYESELGKDNDSFTITCDNSGGATMTCDTGLNIWHNDGNTTATFSWSTILAKDSIANCPNDCYE